MINIPPDYRSTDDWIDRLGKQIRALRIRKQMSQEDLSKHANVGLSAVRGLENGNGSSLSTLISVVRALDKTDWLEALAPAVSISPLQMLKTKSRAPRLRYYRDRKDNDI